MGNESSAPISRDDWTRSGGTVVTAGRPLSQREDLVKHSTRDLPEQRRLSQHTSAVTNNSIASANSHATHPLSNQTDPLGPRRGVYNNSFGAPLGHVQDRHQVVDPPPIVAPHSPRGALIVASGTSVDESDTASLQMESIATPQSIMLHPGTEGGLCRKPSGQSTFSQEQEPSMPHVAPARGDSNDDDDPDGQGSEDSWSDDDGFGVGLGTYLLGVSECSFSSRRCPSAYDRDKRVGFGFNSTTSMNRRVSSFRTPHLPQSVAHSRNPRLSISELGDNTFGLTNSGELQVPVADSMMPLAHFGEPGNSSRHDSSSGKAFPRANAETPGKRSAQSSVAINESVRVSDVSERQDFLIGVGNHRSSLARRAHVRASPNVQPLRHPTAFEPQTPDCDANPPAKVHVVSLEGM